MTINDLTNPVKAKPDQPPEIDQRFDMSVILVCWNNKSYLDPCLQSLYESHLKSAFDVVVVDNGSTDGSLEMLREKFPEVLIIENGHNVGLSKASNQGIEATSGKYILLLNNDTIVNKAALDSMVDYLNEYKEAAAVGGKLLNGDGSFQGGYAKFSTLKEEFLIATGLGYLFAPGYPSHYDADRPLQVGWLSSACLLIRRAALDKIGLLDEQYFIYGDEADLQYRLKEAGWQVIYLPEATTIHFGGRSMNRWKRRKMVYRGKMLFYSKNYKKWRTFILRVLFGVISVLKAIVWSFLYLAPKWRERAGKELRSNRDVIKLSLKLS